MDFTKWLFIGAVWRSSKGNRVEITRMDTDRDTVSFKYLDIHVPGWTLSEDGFLMEYIPIIKDEV